MTIRMISIQVSIIIPMRNLEQEIAGILRTIADQTAGLSTEFIVVDMGSTDSSVLEALTMIKDSKLKGYVVQNGTGTIGAAFNTGIYKARGDYLTFLFPRRLYRNFISSYYKIAEKYAADIIFGAFLDGEQEQKKEETPVIMDGNQAVLDLIHSKMQMDLAAVMLKRSFMLEHHVFFTEQCSVGFSEEFLMRALLCTNRALKCTLPIVRDKIYEVKGQPVKKMDIQCLEKVEAMKRIYELIVIHHKENTKLKNTFLQGKLPDTVLSCVDILLKEGYGYNAIRGMLKIRGYDSLLRSGKESNAKLKKAILTWKMLPWMYKSRL